MQITRKSREDASIILHDYSYDLEAAINATLEGNTNLEAWHERTKKKKTKSKVCDVLCLSLYLVICVLRRNAANAGWKK